ncbi:MAG: hypothetical protein EXS50_00895 [Candidatus Taylorbacteria bacterium]|nr:hypothetical protein [Candidatus Taylorbacteria bacterium]
MSAPRALEKYVLRRLCDPAVGLAAELIMTPSKHHVEILRREYVLRDGKRRPNTFPLDFVKVATYHEMVKHLIEFAEIHDFNPGGENGGIWKLQNCQYVHILSVVVCYSALGKITLVRRVKIERSTETLT